MVLMLLTKTVHPPAGANAIIMIYVHADWIALWNPVLIGVLSLASVAVVWTRLYPGLSRYPVAWLPPSPPNIFWGGWEQSDKKISDKPASHDEGRKRKRKRRK
jgi:CBS-domain-containing membrane protein